MNLSKTWQADKKIVYILLCLILDLVDALEKPIKNASGYLMDYGSQNWHVDILATKILLKHEMISHDELRIFVQKKMDSIKNRIQKINSLG